MNNITNGFIGPIQYNKSFGLSKTWISRCFVSITETIKEDGKTPSHSQAVFDINNLNINGIGYIAGINIYMEDFNNELELLKPDISIPSKWKLIKSINIKKINGNYNKLKFTIDNIPANPKGLYHKFKVEFITDNDEIAQLYPITSTFSGKIDSNNTITFTEDLFTIDSLTGFFFVIYTEDNTPVFNMPMPVLFNTSSSVQLSKIQQHNLPDNTNIKIYSVPSNYLLLLSIDGNGYKFNGINDFTEIASVLEAKVEAMYMSQNGNSQLEHGWGIEDGQLSNNFAHLKWMNMYGHETIYNHLHVDGIKRTVTKAQWNSIDSYVIFAYISDDNTHPYTFPANDSNWKLIAEIPALKKSIDVQPEIEYTVNNLPRGKYISFFVGAITNTTPTSVKLEPQELI